jgi:hypothetical protein
MNKKLILVLLAGMMVITSCKNAGLLYSTIHYDWQKNYPLSGHDSVSTITTNFFNAVEYNGNFTVSLHKAAEAKLVVKTDKMLLKHLKYYIQGNVLKFYFVRGSRISKKTKIPVDIYAPEFISIYQRGPGYLSSEEVLSSSSLYIKQSGSGKIDLKVQSETVRAKVSGSGVINLSGDIRKLSKKISGSGEIRYSQE